MFGWQEDNFIGPTLQANQWTTKWRQFYTQQRVGCLLDAFVQKFGGDINVNDVLSHPPHYQRSPPCSVVITW